MTKQYPLALHIFRRDLRLIDNSALIEALQSSETVIPCFIFDKRQLENNDYKSDHCIQFMAHSLQELDVELKKKNSRLYFFYGIAEEMVAQLLGQLNIKAVYVNRDYTPFSQARDAKIEKICHQVNVDFHSHADILLHEPEEIMQANHKPYTIFTHFFKKCAAFPVRLPEYYSDGNFYKKSITHEDTVTLEKLLRENNLKSALKGGRIEAISLIKKMKTMNDYQEKRDFPALDSTTHLSAHNKFGTLSIREIYAEVMNHFGFSHGLMRELYWRDFFTHIACHYPHVFGGSFHKKYDAIDWSQSEKNLHAWYEGQTGFPIVDAGMRELNSTGYMHNRVRMIVASFLTKDLHIDWRKGEKYFAQKLVDYDPAVNNGNWQWVASTGCDAQPWFRIFNPWLQQKKFDAECIYIKKWVPELSAIAPEIMHHSGKLHDSVIKGYPKPIVDHAVQSQKAKMMYKYN